MPIMGVRRSLRKARDENLRKESSLRLVETERFQSSDPSAHRVALLGEIESQPKPGVIGQVSVIRGHPRLVFEAVFRGLPDRVFRLETSSEPGEGAFDAKNADYL